MKLNLSEKAVKKALELLPADKNALRVSVLGGGCSGLKYELTFVAEFDFTRDQVRKCGDLTVVADSKSALFLDGVTIDYDGSLNGKGFEFHNPKSKTTCGCGESFSV